MNDAVVIRRCSVALVAISLWGSQLEAQGLREVNQPKRSVLGIGLTLARPVGEFQDFVDWGGGVSVYGLVNLEREGPLGIRFDGTLMSYGNEIVRVPFSSRIQRVSLDVETNNLIGSLGVGPQYTFGHGRVRPYAYGMVGFSYFATVSSVRGSADADAFASSTNFDDASAALTGGLGLMLRLSEGKHPVALDLSAQSVYNGRMDYLRKGSLLEAADGSISFIPIRSEANLVSFRIGVAIGV